jgi:hypothetical protein
MQAFDVKIIIVTSHPTILNTITNLSQRPGLGIRLPDTIGQFESEPTILPNL